MSKRGGKDPVITYLYSHPVIWTMKATAAGSFIWWVLHRISFSKPHRIVKLVWIEYMVKVFLRPYSAFINTYLPNRAKPTFHRVFLPLSSF